MTEEILNNQKVETTDNVSEVKKQDSNTNIEQKPQTKFKNRNYNFNRRKNVRNATSDKTPNTSTSNLTTDKVAENIVTPKQQVNILQTNSNLQNKQSLKNVDINNKNINSIIGIGSKKQMSKNKKSLKVMFLGGVGEIGKNMMALEYGEDIIIIDCGATFPSQDEMPGVDLVVPDITYLIQNKNRIRGILITHGHEDHIGAVPYVIGDINCPIYGSRLACALIQNKLREFPKLKAKLISVKPRETVQLGCFTVEFINVCHSIAGSFALAITCPAGLMVHTGDFKIDYTPINNNFTDLTRLGELGSKGVLLLTCESTNVERDGQSMSEKRVGKTLDDLFEKYRDDRIFVATFASNVYRLQELLDLAEKYGRKVTFTGRSMVNVTETAYKIGEIKFNRNNFIDLDKINNYKDSELLIITTGSQGEPMSALTRMAGGEFQKIKLGEHDCVIISASPIPGNEKGVNKVINKLYQLGCHIVYDQLADVHASGHAYKSELQLIHNLIKPKYFMPVHGEFRHQKLHKELAVEMGENERNILLPQIGDVIEVNSRAIKKVGIIHAGQRLVDGLGYGDMESIVLRDRKQLSEDGVAVVVLGMSGKTGEIVSGPDIISRGLVYANEDALIREAKQTIIDSINSAPEKQTDWSIVKNDVRRVLGNFFFRKTKRRPMILTIVIEN